MRCFLQYFIFFLLVTSPLTLKAQNIHDVDSLKNYLLKPNIKDTTRIRLTNEISYILAFSDPVESKKYATTALNLSKKINYKKGESSSLSNLGVSEFMNGRSQKAIDFHLKALQISESIKDSVKMAGLYNNLGVFQENLGNYSLSLNFYIKAIRIAEKINSYKVLSMAYGNTGIIYHSQGVSLKDKKLLFQALKNLYNGLKNSEKTKEKSKIGLCYGNIGSVYVSLYELDSTKTKYLQDAKSYILKGIQLSEEENNKFNLTGAYSGLGKVYELNNDYERALKLYSMALHAAEEINNDKQKATLSKDIGNLYILKKRYDKALIYYTKGLSSAKKTGAKVDISENALGLSKVYKHQKEYKKALELITLSHLYADSVLNDKNTQSLSRLQFEFEGERKDREIVLLNQNKQLQEIKLQKEKNTQYYLIAGIVLVLLLLLLIYNRFIVKTKANKIIEEKNKKLEKLSIVARETANGVFITDANGDLEWFNEGFSKLFGWKSIEEYKKEKGGNIFKVSGNENIVDLINESITHKKSVTYENANDTKNKEQLWIQTTLTPIFDKQGTLNRLVFVETDITKLKNSEAKYQEVNKELEAFTYSVSHDLRSPLRAINGYSKILQDEYSSNLNDEKANALNAIMKNSKKMGELIDDLLNFSRLGRSELTISEIDMNLLVKSIIEEEMIGNLKETEFKINDLQTSKGAQTLIKQVWINLISNAIKFSKHKSDPHIEIGSYAKGDAVVYYVKDNGAGFDIQYYNKLFGVFQRLHSQEEFEGTGIGLAIVQKIIQRHNGAVWAESKVNEGSCFYFSLPI